MMKRFTLKQMRYVETVGRLGSIAAASQALSISQSSITVALDALETELGFGIFTRIPAKGIQTTPSGKDVLRLIRDFLACYQNFETELYATGGTTTGTIRLACFASVATNFLPSVIELFQSQFQNVRFELIEGDMDSVVDLLDNGTADLAFTYQEVTSSHHSFQSLVDLPPYAILHPQDSLSNKESVSLADLCDRPMINLQLRRSRTYYEDLFAQAGLKVNVVHVSSSVQMIQMLVASGFGFSILNARHAIGALPGVGFLIKPIHDALPPRPFGMVSLARVKPPPHVAQFMACCETVRKDELFEKIAVRQS